MIIEGINISTMKINLLIALLFYITSGTMAQSNAGAITDIHMKQKEDKIVLKNLVDTFSVLTDVEDITSQVLLFTEDATIESFRGGQSMGKLTRRKQIGDTLSNFLTLFDVVYHINGQQTVAVEGNNGSRTAYFAVTLVGKENDKDMKTTMGVIYKDKYRCENGKELIALRESNFVWTERKPLDN